MGGFHVHGRQRDFLLTDTLGSFYGANGDPDDTNAVVDATSYYNQPEPAKGNRRERRAKASQERRKKK